MTHTEIVSTCVTKERNDPCGKHESLCRAIVVFLRASRQFYLFDDFIVAVIPRRQINVHATLLMFLVLFFFFYIYIHILTRFEVIEITIYVTQCAIDRKKLNGPRL